MKTRSIITASLVVLLSTVFFGSNAQSANPEIRVLPTTKDGVVKLLVVGANESVDVKFFTADGLLDSDEIKSGEQDFNKKYDVRRVLSNSLTMEVTTAGTSVTYRLAKDKGRTIPYLVKTTYTYPMVASNK